MHVKVGEFGETQNGQYRAKLLGDDMAKKGLVLETTDTGCIVPISHKLNKDGYFRKVINGEWVMYHRFMWEIVHGKLIPEGYEVNHKCKNRACCNVNHLELLEGSEHAIESNTGRNGDRQEAARQYWMKTKCKGVELAKEFGVSFGIACRWIRKWKV